jgi:hypothetical protein
MEHVIIIGIEVLLLVGVFALVLHHRFLTKGQVKHLREEVARLEGIVQAQQTIVADLQSRLISKDRQVTTSREQAVDEYRGQIDTLRQQLDAAVAERGNAYERGRTDGRKEALADWSVVAQPFVEKVSGWFSTKHRVGQKYQLLVKGAPAFEARTVLFEEVDEVDAAMKQTVLAAANSTLQLVSASGMTARLINTLLPDPQGPQRDP